MAVSGLIQITNISSFVSPQQVKELMSYLGDIVELRVFPESEMRALEAPSKVAFVRFRDVDSCNVALHLHETVMGDRQLRITKSDLVTIPHEEQAMSFAAPAADAIPLNIAVELARNQTASALLPTPGLLGTAPVAVAVPQAPVVPLPIPTPAATIPILPDPVSNVGVLSAMGTVIPPPPPLTGNVDPSKIDEIRRTIYVGNLNTTLSAEEVMKFFEPCGKINFVRMAGDETQPTRFAFVEFNEHRSMNLALRLNGGMLGGRPIKVNHSKNAIVKPQAKAPEAEKREAEQAMKKVKEASQLIQTVLDPAVASRTTSTRRSRSRSRSRGRGRSRSPSWGRSRGRRGRRSRSRSYSPRRPLHGHTPSSASRHRSSKYSSSGSRRYRRSRSRSKESRRRRRSRDRSRSRTPKSRSRSRSPKKHKSKKRRHRSSRSKSASPVARSKRSASKSPSRSPTAAGTSSN